MLCVRDVFNVIIMGDGLMCFTHITTGQCYIFVLVPGDISLFYGYEARLNYTHGIYRHKGQIETNRELPDQLTVDDTWYTLSLPFYYWLTSTTIRLRCSLTVRFRKHHEGLCVQHEKIHGKAIALAVRELQEEYLAEKKEMQRFSREQKTLAAEQKAASVRYETRTSLVEEVPDSQAQLEESDEQKRARRAEARRQMRLKEVKEEEEAKNSGVRKLYHEGRVLRSNAVFEEREFIQHKFTGKLKLRKGMSFIVGIHYTGSNGSDSNVAAARGHNTNEMT